MKARLLVDREIVVGQRMVEVLRPDGTKLGDKLEIDTEIAPVGHIIEGPDAYWLCGIHPVVLLPLKDGVSDQITMDGFIAEPADEECLRAAIAKGFVSKDFKLKPLGVSNVHNSSPGDE